MSNLPVDPQRHRDLIREAQKRVAHQQKKSLLPHLYGHKPYQWTLDFWRSTKRLKFIVGANQISKSSALIRHAIDLATDKAKWSPGTGYFPKRPPKVFWYVYPNKDKVEEEFEEKWKREWLPRGEMKDDPVYGWRPIYRRNNLMGIRFNSGVNLYFKTWKTDNQAGTVDAMFVDEELPANLYDELSRRLTAPEGMYCMAFTATLGQPFWYEVMELQGKKGERFPDAFKKCVSVYDCRTYFDGTPSTVWTDEKIIQEKNKCSTEAAIRMRIDGRFSSTEGLKVPSFRRERNIVAAKPVPLDWSLYTGVDIGAGGPDNHPATIAVVAVSPNFDKGRVIRLWKSPKDEYVTTTDILNAHQEITKGLTITANYYDHANKEFYLRSMAAGIAFDKADKSQDFGTDLVNVLFKNQMLDVDDVEFAEDLAQELETLRVTTAKSNAKDDLFDGVRYAVSKIPWDLSKVVSDKEIVLEKKVEAQPVNRRGNWTPQPEVNEWDFDEMVNEYNEMIGEF